MKNNYDILNDVCYILLQGDMFTMISPEDFDKADNMPGTWYAKYSKKK